MAILMAILSLPTSAVNLGYIRFKAAKVLAAFSTSVRDEVDLQRLRADLLAVVNETMQPTQVSLWLKKTNDSRRAIQERP